MDPPKLSIEDQLLQYSIRALSTCSVDNEASNQFVQYILERMADKENKLINDPTNIDYMLTGLFRILKDSDIGNISDTHKTACLCLVNISANEIGLNKINDHLSNEDGSYDSGKVSTITQYIGEKTPEMTNAVLMLLCNVTRKKNLAIKMYEAFLDQNAILETLMKLFITRDKENERHYDYISCLLSNFCQLHEVRMWLMNSHHFEKLLPFVNHNNSIRRSGVIMTLKNCCFELEKHEWLLNEDLDLLSRLLLPLAGPEQFDDEDNEKLPLDLQYLPDDKERESDPNLRLALLEALTQLSAKRNCREIIRDQGTYLILRELHKWEPNMEVKLACENVVDILIKTEDEIATDNYHDLNVPEDLIEKFEKMDQAYLEDT